MACRGRPLGGLLEAIFGLLGGPKRASCEPFGSFLRPLGGFAGALRGLLSASWDRRLDMSARVPPLGPLLGPSWGLFGFLGALFGRLGALLGASWAVLGGSMGASWAVVDVAKAQVAHTHIRFPMGM